MDLGKYRSFDRKRMAEGVIVSLMERKLTKDHNELSDELKYLVSDMYSNIMKAGSIREIMEAKFP